MKLFSFFIVLIPIFYLISCDQPIETTNKKNKENPVKTKTKPTIFECKYDSIVINKFVFIEAYESEKTDSFYVLNKNSIQLIKSYLKDSLIKDYSCCPAEITGIMTVFSEGKKCMTYSIGSAKGVDRKENDTSSIYIVPHNYQTRIKIPNKIWKTILNDVIRVKIEIE